MHDQHPGPPDPSADVASDSQRESLAEVERAIAALESQREVLGDAVVETALGPLRARRTTLRDAAVGERRRLVTVLFADLEGFTVLSRRLDPEDTRDVVNRCFSRWRRAVEEHGGRVEKYIGDAAMAVFGLTTSQEDDAARAVRAGRAMIEALGPVASETERRHGERLHMRVGIDTGSVVVSTLDERGTDDFVAIGPTVNRASRLQGAAPRDGVLISEATHRLVRGTFGLDPRPGLELKGIDDPVDAYVVLAERPARFVLDPTTGVGGTQTLTIGRETELLRLREHLADVVEESRWKITTITGDAGLGKSRLLADLDVWLGERPERVWWFRGRAYPTSENRPHALLCDAVATRFGITPIDSPATVAERCEAGYVRAFGPSPRARREARMVARWLGFAVDDEPGIELPREPQMLRDEASDVLARYLARLSRINPVVLMCEDLHWADDASLTWLDAADDLLADCPVWVVATARPSLYERRPLWGEGLSHHATVPLTPLSTRDTRALLAQLLQRVEEVPRALADLVVETADGNPFYVEELVTWFVDAGVVVPGDDAWTVRPERLGRAEVPTTLTSLLQSRLDSLRGRERSVLQRASVVGRVFWDRAVERLGDGTEPSPVPETLDGLRGRGLVLQRQRSAFEDAGEYLFKHALLRDATYEGMLRSHRRAFHARAADWLVRTTTAHGRTEEFAALVADHADKADDPRAASWYLRAGRRAATVYANEEALRLLERGIALVVDDPDLRFDLLAEHETVSHRLADRVSQLSDLEEMTLLLDVVSDDRPVVHHVARARMTFDISEYTESVRWADRAVEAADRLGLAEAGAEARLMAGKAHTWAHQNEAARAALQDALERARLDGLPPQEGESLRYLGMLAGNVSDYPTSLEHLAEARRVFEADGDAEGVGRTLVQTGSTLFNMDRLDEARRMLEEARPAFERSGDRYAVAVVVGNVATIAARQGELGAALTWIDDALVRVRRIKDVEATAVNLTVRSDITLQVGRYADAEVAAAEAAGLMDTLGNESLACYAFASWARAVAARGDLARAEELARQAVAVGEHGISRREAASARLNLAHVLRARATPSSLREAGSLYDTAREQLADLGLDGGALEARAGSAATRLAVGEHGAAVGIVDEVLPTLQDDTAYDGIRPELVLRPCLEVLEAVGDDRAVALRERARAVLLARADLAGPDLRVAYLASLGTGDLLGD